MQNNDGRDQLTRWLAVMAIVAACCLVARTAAAVAPLTVTVEEDSATHTVIRYQIGHYDLIPVQLDGANQHVRARLGKESSLGLEGAPALPTVNRSIIIGGDALMQVEVISSSYHEVPYVDVLPSRGTLYRPQSPDSVPYTFGPIYQTDALYPSKLASLSDAYIMRDDRGVVVTLQPFQYNPVQRVLRVYDDVTLKVVRVGTDSNNLLSPPPRPPSRAFEKLAKRHFINLGQRGRYAPLDEDGELLIIAHDAWLANLEPLVAHKSSIGITTKVVGVSSIGNSSSAIKSYIQSAYDSSNLAFVLLVGDSQQVATPWASGGFSDPSYSKLAGSDHYPDIFVGRFSAETPGHVDTQVQRTIDYELQQATQQPWFRRGVGIASNEGPGDDGEMDWQHMDNIRNDLLGKGYTHVDQIYDPGASAGQVVAALNQGRGIVNYCGHGNKATFGTSGFSNGHASSLNNVGKLPFVLSVACNTGEFGSGTSLGEAMLRSHNGGPTGAIGMYASSVLQSWSPPMAAQDETIDMFVAEQYFTLGALAFAGSARMMDEYGSGGVEMFDTWILFGDPSLRVVGIVEPVKGLRVTPHEGFEAKGKAGGPFDVTERIYTLEAGAAEALDFSVHHSVPWLSVEPASGNIPPGGTVAVKVMLNEEAASLPDGYWNDSVMFVNNTDHDGDTERQVGITVGEPELQYEWPLDDNPGWITEGAWAFGTPMGGGGVEFGSPDPTSGHEGANVYGYNLQGDYPNNLPGCHLTTTAIDCRGLSKVSIKFYRWLNVEGAEFDHASVSVSDDQVNWATIWQNDTSDLADSSWHEVILDISAVADGKPTVYLRWTMGNTDEGLAASGWNIDDVELWAISSGCQDDDSDGELSIHCGGNDCDNSNPAVHSAAVEICGDGVDNDCDGSDAACSGGGDSSTQAEQLGDNSGLVGVVCGCRLVGAPSPSRQVLLLLGLLGAALCSRRQRTN